MTKCYVIEEDLIERLRGISNRLHAGSDSMRDEGGALLAVLDRAYETDTSDIGSSGLLSQIAKLLAPHLVDQLTIEVGKRLEISEDHIGEIVREELRSCDFIDEDRAREIADEQIADIDFEDQIDERCNYQGYLDDDGVKEVLRNCRISIDV